jgi:hypothetical protein
MENTKEPIPANQESIGLIQDSEIEATIKKEMIKKAETPLIPEEIRALEQWREKKSKTPQSTVNFKHKTKEDGSLGLAFENAAGNTFINPDLCQAAISLATGAANFEFSTHLLSMCVVSSGRTDSDIDTAIINALRALDPKDEFEGMLITRLVSLHFQSMVYLSSQGREDLSLKISEVYFNRSVKLMRLYNETLDALMRYRRKGEQRVTVQHVNVSDGGKAIIGGSLSMGGGDGG